MEAEEQTIDGTGIRRRQARALRLRSPRHRRHGRAERDLRVDNVRGVLIILVVIGHFLLPFSRTPLVTNLIYVIYSFHMPCFVLLSGFYAKSAFRNGRFRWGKVVQFLWLYVLYKLLVDITEGLLAGSIPLLPDFLHESGAPWYLFAISCWYLTLPLLRRFNRWPLNGIVLLAILLLVVFGKYFVTCGDFLCMDRVLSFAPFFYLGYFCSPKLLGRYLASGWKRWVNLLALLLALGFLFFSYSVLYPVHLVFYGAQYTRYAPSLWNWLWLINLLWYAAALVLSLGLIGVMTSRRIGFVTKIGQRTLQVYVLHRPSVIWHNILGFMPCLTLPVCPMCCLCCCWHSECPRRCPGGRSAGCFSTCALRRTRFYGTGMRCSGKELLRPFSGKRRSSFHTKRSNKFIGSFLQHQRIYGKKSALRAF